MKLEKKKITIADISELKKEFGYKSLNTVCESAKCPNIGECFKRRTATFLIMGKNCTRGCRFCGIEKHKPEPIDKSEPKRIAEAVKELGLSYSVITSVTRDDLPDEGANHFAQTVYEIKKILPDTKVEVLVPDFSGKKELIDIVLNSKPEVFSHNIETVPSLYPKVRKGADYKRSLQVLEYAKSKNFKVKTGIMLGLGENKNEIYSVIDDIVKTGTDILTVGQYLAPTKKHYPVIKEYTSDEFEEIKAYAENAGIKLAICGRYIRSSYLADEHFKRIT